jgi:RNA polymerase sigma-70 factor (sigma-E family)
VQHPYAVRGGSGSAGTCNLRAGSRHGEVMGAGGEAEFRTWAAPARVRLRRTAFLLCGDWHLAEDLTQDTLVRVYAVWDRVSASGPPDAYAVRTLVNCQRAAARRPWRREHVVADVPDRADARPSAGSGAEERDRLIAALRGLGRSQRAIVVLRYWDDLSVDEVSQILGIAPGTVKSQSARGLARLRELLDAPPATRPDQRSRDRRTPRAQENGGTT